MWLMCSHVELQLLWTQLIESVWMTDIRVDFFFFFFCLFAFNVPFSLVCRQYDPFKNKPVIDSEPYDPAHFLSAFCPPHICPWLRFRKNFFVSHIFFRCFWLCCARQFLLKRTEQHTKEIRLSHCNYFCWLHCFPNICLIWFNIMWFLFYQVFK